MQTENLIPTSEITLLHVLVASTATAICTGLGVAPFFFVKNLNKRFLGIGNAIAAGLMTGASVGLSWEAGSISIFKLGLGLSFGVLLVVATNLLLSDPQDTEDHAIIKVTDAGFRRVLVMLGVMTAHSFAEGIGVGVSFGGRQGLGDIISTAIAIHNVPEGIAICLVLIPRGYSKLKASLWSIFSSLPQPIMAVPAFLFVLAFKPFLPIGLGLAAGAMFYLVVFELLPESLENTTTSTVMLAFGSSTVSMLVFQSLL